MTLLIVAASPVPQLVACIIISDSLLYVALLFVICMLYDGGNFSSFREKCVVTHA